MLFREFLKNLLRKKVIVAVGKIGLWPQRGPDSQRDGIVRAGPVNRMGTQKHQVLHSRAHARFQNGFEGNALAAMANNPLSQIPTDAESRTLMQRGFTAMTRFFSDMAITAPWNASSVGPKRKLSWCVYPLSDFREIRRALGGTINDVALAMVSEGAARYLKQHGEDVGDQKFRVMCPVNVRTEDDKGALGNRVSAIFPMFPAYCQEIPARYQTVCEETARIKGTQEAQAMTLMQESSPSVPPITMAPLLLVGSAIDPTRLAANFPPPVLPAVGRRPPNFGVNFVLTNVPGVQVTQYIAGHQMLETLSIMMISGNMGLGIAAVSYDQKMIFNFTSDPRLLPDLDVFAELVDSAYTELLAAAKEQSENAAA